VKLRLLFLAGLVGACGSAGRTGFEQDADGGSGDPGPHGSIHAAEDAGTSPSSHDGGKDSGAKDSGAKKDSGGSVDSGATLDAGITPDAGATADTGSTSTDAGAAPETGSTWTGPITGGSCISGATGATAIRVGWVNAAGKAQATYDVNGLPDKSRWKVGAYGYSVGFSASFVDPYLGPGGVQLDGSDFIDIELSTAGLSVIHSATLSIYGRSYNTTTSGSFEWQTFDGQGSAPSGVVSNAAPYTWTSADATTEFSPNDNGVLLRIKAGPPSDALVVNKIELCIDAD
jgi:hypothetical protein